MFALKPRGRTGGLIALCFFYVHFYKFFERLEFYSRGRLLVHPTMALN